MQHTTRTGVNDCVWTLVCSRLCYLEVQHLGVLVDNFSQAAFTLARVPVYVSVWVICMSEACMSGAFHCHPYKPKHL